MTGALSTAEGSHPASEVGAEARRTPCPKGGGQEELPHVQGQRQQPTSWQIDGETVADFIFWGSKITADSDCSHEMKRHLLLGRKVMTNLDSILKSRDITLPTK